MDALSLLPKLIEIERAAARRGDCALRRMVLEAQDGVRQLQCENEELALQNAALRRHLNAVHRFTHLAHSEASATEAAEGARPFLDAGDEEENPRVWRTTHLFTS